MSDTRSGPHKRQPVADVVLELPFRCRGCEAKWRQRDAKRACQVEWIQQTPIHPIRGHSDDQGVGTRLKSPGDGGAQAAPDMGRSRGEIRRRQTHHVVDYDLPVANDRSGLHHKLDRSVKGIGKLTS